MHQFKIEVFNYKENGSVGDLHTTRYAENPEQARLICQEYGIQKMDVPQEDGTTLTFKRYKVDLYYLCYKLSTDKDAFFAQFQA